MKQQNGIANFQNRKEDMPKECQHQVFYLLSYGKIKANKWFKVE